MHTTVATFALLWTACSGVDEQTLTEDTSAGRDDLEAPWSSPDAMGPLQVGTLTMEWEDHRGKDMMAEVWYPARPKPDEELATYPPIAIGGVSTRWADADTRFGPRPLVAFSHGYGGVRFQSLYLTEYLASHGFVVVSPRHQYNTFLDLNDDHLLDITVQRPGDVIEAVDEVLRRSRTPDEHLEGLIDGEDYAVLGHSFGALTSMMVGGGVIDLDGLRARCATHGGRLCGSLDGLTAELLSSHRMTDPRAVVTVPMAPGMWYAFGPDGLSAPGLEQVRHPLILSGAADPVLRYADEALPTYQNMATPKTLVNFQEAGHYAFSNMCDFVPYFTTECEGLEGGWADINRVQTLSRTVALAHIRVAMLGDERDLPYLAEEWLVNEADVTVQTD